MQKNTAEGGMRPLAIALVVLGGLIRATQRLNFAPVGAMSLFAGARLRGWQAYLLPLALMAITDPLLGGYSALTPLVYLSFLLNVWIGSRLRQTESPVWIGSAALVGAVQFFVITNFGSWLVMTADYPRSFAGLMACFSAGVPFFWRTLASDLIYSGVLFGLHAWLSRYVAREERVAVHA